MGEWKINKSSFFLLLGVACAVMSLGFTHTQGPWKKISYGIGESEINDVIVNPKDRQVIFTATAKGIYRSGNGGRSFRQVYYSGGSGKGINFFYIWQDQGNHIYAAGEGGLVMSRNDGAHWHKIYETRETDDDKALSFIRNENELFLGTASGLLWQRSGEDFWQRFTGELGRVSVYCLAEDKEDFYALTATSLYRITKQSHEVIKIFESGFGREETGDFDDEQEEAELAKRDVKDVYVDKKTGGVLLATNKGIFESLNKGENWQKFLSDNIPLPYVTAIVSGVNLQGGAQTIIASSQGVYFLRGKSWSRIYQGMETDVVNRLALTEEGAIYAATDRGIFVSYLQGQLDGANDPGVAEKIDYKKIQENFSHEPSIHQVHKWAIDYAEVHPGKIKKWRQKADRRAWFPKLSIKADGTKNKTISDSLWGSYTSGGQHYLGPDDKTFYDNFGWGASLSWDFADLIWSTNQTTIDSRSKMMVELREDILDQVTRIYFERRRTQIELVLNIDTSTAVEKEMRIEELTALLDSFTDQKFSQEIRLKTN